MSYYAMTCSELVEQFQKIHDYNAATIETLFGPIDVLFQVSKGTEAEGYVAEYSRKLKYFESLHKDLKNGYESINAGEFSHGFLNRISTIGEEARRRWFSFRNFMDKKELFGVLGNEHTSAMNDCYARISDNLYSLGEIEEVVFALIKNCLNVTPFGELKKTDIALQDPRGFTVDKSGSIYFKGNHIKVVGQRYQVLDTFVRAGNQTVQWHNVRNALTGDITYSQKKVVKRVSELNIRLLELGFDQISFERYGEGDQVGWRLCVSGAE